MTPECGSRLLWPEHVDPLVTDLWTTLQELWKAPPSRVALISFEGGLCDACVTECEVAWGLQR